MKQPKLQISQSLKKRLIAALKEDVGFGDVTSQWSIPKTSKSKAQIIAKENGVLSGSVLIPLIFKSLDSKLKVKVLKKDASLVKKGQVILKIEGPSRSILTAERLALNLLGKLSGIATTTQSYVKQIASKQCQLLATRKTTPLWRDVEKYAVECGGGFSHRFGLYDQYLIKDNHKTILCELDGDKEFEIYQKMMKERNKRIPLQIEVDSIKELPWAFSYKPNMILLDNFKINELKRAVVISRQLAKEIKIKEPLLEASGGITLKNIKQISKTGVDRISVGAITHSAPNFDFSLEIL